MTTSVRQPNLRAQRWPARAPAEPVFVIGAPFSGVTPLAWAISQHPELEPALGGDATEALAGALRVLDEDVLPLLGSGVIAPADSAFRGAGDGASPLVATALRAVAREVEASSRSHAPHRWVASGSAYLSRLPLLAKLLPDLRLLHVLREPGDVLSNLLVRGELDGVAVSPAVAERIRHDAVAACVEAEQLFGSDQVLRVGYEELVQDPEHALRRCLSFLGESWSDDCLWPLRLLTTDRVRLAAAAAVPPGTGQERPSPPPRALVARDSAPVSARLQRGVRRAVESVVPSGATVLVVTRGDESLLRFRERRGSHFPQLGDGTYAGHYPADGAAAVAQLEELRLAGASHLAFPQPAFWWLDHYDELRRHLEASARLVACDMDSCIVWELDQPRPLRLPASLRVTPRTPQEPDNQDAFRIDDPTPPPKRRRRLGGDLWAITAYYNPASYRTKSANYASFRDGLRDAGVPLLTVELAFGDTPFELEDGDADLLLRLRGGDVLWQKERLLNLGLKALPAGCDKVTWIDGDVLFARPDWAVETARLLEEYLIVQPFSHCVRLPGGQSSCEPAMLPAGPGEGELFHGMAWGMWAKGRRSLAHYSEHGHTGFAWAGRRDLLDRHGLYDANLLGNGDTDIAHAMFGSSEYWGLQKLGPIAQTHLRKWARPFAADVGGSVSHVDGVITHLWHGRAQDRLYDRHLGVLDTFDPDRDLGVDPSTGLHRWAGASEELRAWSEGYFRGRREDGP